MLFTRISSHLRNEKSAIATSNFKETIMQKLLLTIRVEAPDMRELIERAGHRALVPRLIRQYIREGLEEGRKLQSPKTESRAEG